MKIVVLGATGFVGRHLVEVLLERNHQLTAVARTPGRASSLPWIDEVRFVKADMYADDLVACQIGRDADAIVDLIWPGLPNYMGLFHFETNWAASYRMVKSFVLAGCRQILVAGTCLEYGLQNGCLSAEIEPRPHTPYAFAKHSLHTALEFLQTETPFLLQWARLFYIHGKGQNPESLLPLLDSAIERGDDTFPMSGGEQLRDFLTVESAAEQLARLIEHQDLSGTFNICSGRPTSVRRLVEERLQQKGSDIRLELGHYPYPKYEPMAFWGQAHPELLPGSIP